MTGKLLYHFFIFFYSLGVRIASLWNPKARLWVKGRNKFPEITSGKEQRVWMHCASLGEFEQGRPLLEKIREQYPGTKIILTFFSPSGYEVIKNYKGADHIFYLPLDTASNAARFIQLVNPQIAVIIKYEFWFHFMKELNRHLDQSIVYRKMSWPH